LSTYKQTTPYWSCQRCRTAERQTSIREGGENTEDRTENLKNLRDTNREREREREKEKRFTVLSKIGQK